MRKPRDPLVWMLTALALSQDVTVNANPVNQHVINGRVAVTRPDGATVQVTNSPNAIINWESFSVDRAETTRFVQENSASTVLNRVTGQDPSAIMGRMLSNGRVFLINPNGMVIGPGAVIDTAGFVGSSLNLKDEDFLAGKLEFGDGEDGEAIRNMGLIQSRGNGGIYLIAPSIENSGIIRTEGGELVLAAGRKVSISSLDLDHIDFEIQAPEDRVLNIGSLLIEGSGVGQKAIGVFAGTLSNHGAIQADTVSRDAQGNIRLVAQQNNDIGTGALVSASGPLGGTVRIESKAGRTRIAGKVRTRGLEQGGGTLYALGEQVTLTDTAILDARGEQDGGTVLVGGDYQGKGESRNAKTTAVASGAVIDASATTLGDGGKVIVWADNNTQFDGKVSVRGGAQAGDGGFVEVSGKGNLGFHGSVDASAAAGAAGTLLLDPLNIIIVDQTFAKDDHELPPDGQIPASQRPDDSFEISVAALERLQGDIDVLLEAGNDIIIRSSLNLRASTGSNVTFRADADPDDDLTSGGMYIAFGSTIQTSGGSLIIEAATLAGDGSPANGVVNLATDGGDITLSTRGTIGTGGGSIEVDSSSASRGAGSIAITSAQGDVAIGRVEASAKAHQAGRVILSAEQTLRVGPIATGGGDITLKAGERIGILGDVSSSGGDIRLSSKLIDLGSALVDTRPSVPGTGPGEINLDAGTNGEIVVVDNTLVTDQLSLAGTLAGTGTLLLMPATLGQDIHVGDPLDGLLSASNLASLENYRGTLSLGGSVSPEPDSNTARAGDILVGEKLSAGGDLTLVALGDIAVEKGGLLEAGRVLSLAALGNSPSGGPGNISDPLASVGQPSFIAPEILFMANSEAGTARNPLSVLSGANTIDVGAGTGLAFIDGEPGRITGSGPGVQSLYRGFESIGIVLDPDILNTRVVVKPENRQTLPSDLVPPPDEYPRRFPEPFRLPAIGTSTKQLWNNEVDHSTTLDQWLELGPRFRVTSDGTAMAMDALISRESKIIVFLAPGDQQPRAVTGPLKLNEQSVAMSITGEKVQPYKEDIPLQRSDSPGKAIAVLPIPDSLLRPADRVASARVQIELVGENRTQFRLGIMGVAIRKRDESAAPPAFVLVRDRGPGFAFAEALFRPSTSAYTSWPTHSDTVLMGPWVKALANYQLSEGPPLHDDGVRTIPTTHIEEIQFLHVDCFRPGIESIDYQLFPTARFEKADLNIHHIEDLGNEYTKRRALVVPRNGLFKRQLFVVSGDRGWSGLDDNSNNPSYGQHLLWVRGWNRIGENIAELGKSDNSVFVKADCSD